MAHSYQNPKAFGTSLSISNSYFFISSTVNLLCVNSFPISVSLLECTELGSGREDNFLHIELNIFFFLSTVDSETQFREIYS